MGRVFIREVLKEHLHGLKACIQQHKIHYPAPHADHDNAEEIACIFQGITSGLSKQSLQYFIYLFFLPLELSFKNRCLCKRLSLLT